MLATLRFSALAIAAVLLLVGCNGTGPGCDVCTTSAEVYGNVTDAAGQPAAGATVTIVMYRDRCAGEPLIPPPGGEPWVLTTDPAGAYQDRLRTPFAPFTACLVVRVTPASGPGAEVVGTTVRFAAGYPRQSRERVRIDLRLPAAP